MIEDYPSEPSPSLAVEAMHTPATGTRQKRSDPQSAAKIPTPGRAHRCPPKTLFPKITYSVDTVVTAIVDDLVNRVVAAQPEQTIPPTQNTPPTQERDFAEMLSDALEQSPPSTPVPNADATGNIGLLNWYKERCAQLQRDIIASEVKFTKIHEHAASLEAMVSLLNEDSTEKQREIKRLQVELDKSRLKVSQATGIRRHLDADKEKSNTPPHNNLPKGNTGGKKSVPSTANIENTLKSIQTELAANRAQMHELQKQVSSTNHAADSDHSGYTTVRSRRAKRREPHPPTQTTPSGSSPQPSPVNSHQPPSYADITAQRASKPTTLSFGTSLARGTKNALRNNNVEALEYSFPGYDLPGLRGEIIPILQENPQVDTVVVTAGGNDCEKYGVTLPQIKAEYDALIDAIKIQQGWECKVIINAVPQRRRITHEARHKIAGLNLEHYYHSDPDKHVFFVDSAPKTGAFFRDRVHLNYHGQDYWARKVAGVISNFHPVVYQTRM